MEYFKEYHGTRGVIMPWNHVQKHSNAMVFFIGGRKHLPRLPKNNINRNVN